MNRNTHSSTEMEPLSEGAAPTIQDAVLPDKLFTLTVDMQPSTVGPNDIHMYATTPDGKASDVQEWRVRASMPEKGIEAIDAAVLRITPDHATATINLPAAGSWTLDFTIRVSEVDQSTVTTGFQVR